MKNINRRLSLSALLLLIVSVNSFAQPEIEWQRFFGGPGFDLCRDAVPTRNGGYALLGEYRYPVEEGGNDFCIYVTDSAGNSEWSRVYRAAGEQETNAGAEYSGGGFLLAGEFSGYGYTLRIDANGDSLWAHSFENQRIRDFSGGVKIGANDCAVLAGTSLARDGDFAIVKIDSLGEVVWFRSFGTRNREECLGMTITSDGGFLLAGVSVRPNTGRGGLLLKLNSDGDSLWMREYEPETSEGLTSSIELPDGDYAAAGFGNSLEENCDFYLLRIDREGNRLWSQIYREEYHQYCYTLAFAGIDGGFLLGGVNRRGLANSWLLKTDFAGEVVWDRRFGTNGESGVTTILEQPDYSYVIASTQYCNVDENLRNDNLCLSRTDHDPAIHERAWFSLYRSLHDYGNVLIDSSSSWDIRLINRGGRYGTIDSMAFSSGAVFSCSVEPPFGIFPSDTLWLPINFHPRRDSLYLDTLYLWTSHNQDPRIEVFLSGRGVPENSVRDDPRNLNPVSMSLSAYPNPFNGQTVISFNLDKAGFVDVGIFDLSGRRISTVFQGHQNAGRNNLLWNAEFISSGVYFIKVACPSGMRASQIALLR